MDIDKIKEQIKRDPENGSSPSPIVTMQLKTYASHSNFTYINNERGNIIMFVEM